MADDAGDCVDVGRDLRGGLDRPEAGVEDVVPIVRAHGLRLVLPEFDLTAELPQGGRRDLPAERVDLDGNRRLRAEAGTSFDSSTITTNFFDAAATIFSRNNAPPRPLIRSSLGSTSSAPSTHRSSRGNSSSEVSGMPRPFDASAVAKEVGTPFRSAPSRTRREIPQRKCCAVDPVPRP